MVSLPASLPALVCAQLKWPFNNVGQPTFPLKALLLIYIAEWTPKSVDLPPLSSQTLPTPTFPSLTLLQPRGFLDVLWMGQTYCCLRTSLWLSQASVRDYPLATQEASFLNPVTFLQMPSSPWGLCWPPYLKLQPPVLNSQHHLSCSFYCLPNGVTYCFYLLPNFLVRM